MVYVPVQGARHSAGVVRARSGWVVAHCVVSVWAGAGCESMTDTEIAVAAVARELHSLLTTTDPSKAASATVLSSILGKLPLRESRHDSPPSSLRYTKTFPEPLSAVP